MKTPTFFIILSIFFVQTRFHDTKIVISSYYIVARKRKSYSSLFIIYIWQIFSLRSRKLRKMTQKTLGKARNQRSLAEGKSKSGAEGVKLLKESGAIIVNYATQIHIIVKSSLGSAPLRCFSASSAKASTICFDELKCVLRSMLSSRSSPNCCCSWFSASLRPSV